jgi:hypothetical protein
MPYIETQIARPAILGGVLWSDVHPTSIDFIFVIISTNKIL